MEIVQDQTHVVVMQVIQEPLVINLIAYNQTIVGGMLKEYAGVLMCVLVFQDIEDQIAQYLIVHL